MAGELDGQHGSLLRLQGKDQLVDDGAAMRKMITVCIQIS